MATYTELTTLVNDSELKSRIKFACVVFAENIRTENNSKPNRTPRRNWARKVFKEPEHSLEDILWAFIVSCRNMSIIDIKNSSDTFVQGKIDAIIDIFVEEE